MPDSPNLGTPLEPTHSAPPELPLSAKAAELLEERLARLEGARPAAAPVPPADPAPRRSIDDEVDDDVG